MADVDQRFFCHQCSVEIPRVAADFTCPTCNSGFIEELDQSQPPALTDGEEDMDEDEPIDMGQVLGPLEALLPRLLGPGLGPMVPGGGRVVGGHRAGIRPRIRIARGGNMARPQNLGMDQVALENALQDFIVNLAGMDFGGVHGGAGPGAAQIHFVNPGGPGGGFHLHGNPGDYAWGRGGLDAIITQLLNHMDGTGPPPMDKENIAGIPTVELTAEQKEKNTNCSVCWEDFTEGESVKQLECEHCFHGPCIVPWLELHGTCPVCRKELVGRGRNGPGAMSDTETASTVSGTEDEAVGGEPPGDTPATDEPRRRASVTVTGGGGLTGFIQSALNQVFATPWATTSQQNGGGSTSSSSTSTSPNPASTANQDTTESSSQGVSSSSAPRDSQSSEDDGTPASRRPRLDSEFVDLDFD